MGKMKEQAEEEETVNCEQCDLQFEIPTRTVEEIMAWGQPVVCSAECYDLAHPEL